MKLSQFSAFGKSHQSAGLHLQRTRDTLIKSHMQCLFRKSYLKGTIKSFFIIILVTHIVVGEGCISHEHYHLLSMCDPH